MTIQNKIIILRDRAGLTQDDVAGYLKMSKSSYSRKERGISAFTVDDIEKMLKLFKVTYSDLLDLEFPIIHEEVISQDLLTLLEEAIDNGEPSYDWADNKAKYDAIQEALVPVLEEKNKSFDFPSINIADIPSGTIVKQVNMDVRAESLIKRAFDVQTELAHRIFGAVR